MKKGIRYNCNVIWITFRMVFDSRWQPFRIHL